MPIKCIFAILVLSLISETTLSEENNICDKSCTFVLLSESSGKYQIINKERANLRLPPYSTFKIANTLIALETGVVSSVDEKLSFDPNKYPVQKWWPKTWYETPLNIREAFSYSAVPVYQSIAVKINAERMLEYVKKFKYGNQDITSGVDIFWLGKSLEITAKEQVEFVRKLYQKELPLSENVFSKMKKIMLSEETENYKLYSKTGAGQLPNQSLIGWYVGIVENKEGAHYFALNLNGNDFGEVIEKRIKVARGLLKEAGILRD